MSLNDIFVELLKYFVTGKKKFDGIKHITLHFMNFLVFSYLITIKSFLNIA